MKIEPCPCPVCKGHYQLNLNHWQEHDDPDVRTCYQVQCFCGYSAELCYSRNEAAIAHNALCDLICWGRAAKEFVEKPPRFGGEITRDNSKFVLGFSEGVKRCRYVLKAAMEEK